MATIADGDTAPGLTSGALFEEYRRQIHRYILSLVKNPAEAEDLLQETFLRVHKHLPSLRDPATLSAWLYRIATNVSYDRLRQTARAPLTGAAAPGGEEPVVAEPADTKSPGIEEAFQRAEMSECVREYIEALGDDFRAVILLHDLEGLTNPEIAALLDCSLETVKIRLHRARGKLKEALAAGCDFSHDDRDALVCDRHAPRK